MPKAVFVSSGLFFYSSCSKATERGEKESYCISTKALESSLAASCNRMNTCYWVQTICLLITTDPRGTGVGFEFHLSFSESLLAVTVPPPILTAQSTGDSDLLSAVGFRLLSKLKWGFLVCSVLTRLENTSFYTIVIWNSVVAMMNAFSARVSFTHMRRRAAV